MEGLWKNFLGLFEIVKCYFQTLHDLRTKEFLSSRSFLCLLDTQSLIIIWSTLNWVLPNLHTFGTTVHQHKATGQAQAAIAQLSHDFHNFPAKMSTISSRSIKYGNSHGIIKHLTYIYSIIAWFCWMLQHFFGESVAESCPTVWARQFIEW